MSNPHPFETVRGYICQDFSGDDNKDDDGDEDEEQDWDDQELDAISSGALHIQPKKPPYRKVMIRKFENRQTVCVHGNFLSTDPWWEVTVTLRPKTSMGTIHGKQVIRAMRYQPSYRIRNDRWLDEGGNYGSVLIQFLTECKLEDTTKEHFMHYIRNKAPRSGHVTFETIFGVLKDCEMIEDEKTRDLLCLVRPYIVNSECGLLVQQALDNPTLFQLMPQLLPDRTVALLKQCGGDKQKLNRLETTLQEKPWAFGFSVALRKETNVVLTEVSVDRFKQAGLLDNMERHIQDGLHCYYVLKRKCWNEGKSHLSMGERSSLRKQLQKTYPGYKVRDWAEMWDFLEDVNAVHKKEKGKWVKIFLYRYWKAEDKIVKCLGKILDRGEQDLSCLKNASEEDKKEDAEDKTEKGVDKQKTLPDSESPEDDDPSLSQLIGNISSDHSAGEDDDHIPGLINSRPLVPILDKEALEEKDQESFKNDKTQHAAARSMRENPFTIISGKGGCGKTHVVCKVLEDYPSYAVTMAAPTGKAASNLRKRSKGGIESFTLHQISWQYTNYMKNLKEYKKANKVDNDVKEPHFIFEQTEILVVDECSMVPITVFSNVLHALLYQGKLKKLVLLGDYRQLPSVEPGNLLSDLYKVFKQYGWSIELTMNHRAESQLIVDNATEISNQRMPKFDGTKGFSMVELPENDGHDNVQYLHQVVQNLYTSDESIKDHKRSQFVAFRKADCFLLNDWCCPLYAGHNTVAVKDGKQVYNFQTGDKICPTHNANVTDYLEQEDKNKSTMAGSMSFRERNDATQDVQFNDNTQKSSGLQSGAKDPRTENVPKSSLLRNNVGTHSVNSTGGAGSSSNQQAAYESTKSSLPQSNVGTLIKDKAGPSSNQQAVDEAAEIAFLEQLCSQQPVSPFPGEEKGMEDEKEKKEDKNEKRICNGEIYFIEGVHEIQEPGKKKKDERITMNDGDAVESSRQSLCAPLRELRGKAAIRHAWARTIHTYQGSESETVIYLLGNSGAQNWQHVYTAITRGKTRVYIIGTKSNLQKAIRRDARVRNTEMREMLMEEIIPKLKEIQQQQMNQTCSQRQQLSQICSQRQQLNQTCSQRQQLNQTCSQQQLSQNNVTMTAKNATLCKGGPGNSTFRNSQMYSASQRSSQVHNPTLVRPSRFGNGRTGLVQNSAPDQHKGTVSSEHGSSGQTSLQPPRNRTLDFFQPMMTSTQVSSANVNRKEANMQPPPQPSRTSNSFQPLLTSTQVPSSSRNQSALTFDQAKQMPFFSPKKIFTSIKDAPKTSSLPNRPNVNGLVHSTPKRSACPDKDVQQENASEYDDWSDDWSSERLQQVMDMETTAMATQRDANTPPLYDEEDKSDSSDSPTDSGFKSTPPDSKPTPEVVSPFTPKSSLRLSTSWAVKSPPKTNAAKRLYMDMKESPITDGLPNKKHNDFNESLF